MLDKLGKLFRGDPLASDDAATRLAGLEALAGADEVPASSKPKLAELARSDSDDGVRRAAIALLDDGGAIAGLLDDDRVGDAAAEQLLRVSPSGSASHPRVRAARLRSVEPGEELAGLIRDANRDERLAAASTHASAEARLQIARSLRDPESLSTLERVSLNADKSVHRYAREALDQVKQLQATAASQLDELSKARSALTEALAQPVSGTWRSVCDARLSAVSKQREGLAQTVVSLAEYDVDTNAAAEALIDTESGLKTATEQLDVQRLPALIDRLAAIEAMLATGKPAGAAQATMLLAHWSDVSRTEQASDAVTERIEALAGRASELASALASTSTLERLLSEAEATPAPKPPEQDKADPWRGYWRAVNRTRSLHDSLSQARQATAWPSWCSEPPILAGADAAVAELSAALTDADSRASALKQRAVDALAELSSKLDSGTTDGVGAALSSARQVIACLKRDETKDLDAELKTASARYDELTDWQDFATRPKRVELVTAMKLIAQSPLEGPAQANEVKSLRGQWQALGPVRKGEDRHLQQQFDDAAEKAFEPTRAFFDEQKTLRKENAEKRAALCDELEAWLSDRDWSSTNLKDAQNRLRSTREQWNALHPVDRKRDKGLSKRFETSMDALHKALKDRWQANIDAKEAIVAEAEALASGDDRRSIDKTKALQKQWQEVGPTPRGADQKLWKRFRTACDAVFNARSAERDRFKAELAEHVTTAVGIIDRLAADCQSNASMALFNAARDQLNALPISPDDLPKGARSTLRDAEQACKDAERGARQAKKLAELTSYRTEPAGDGDDSDHRALTVEAELLAGIDSPEDDAELRSTLHLEQLQAKMSGGELNRDPKQLALRWQALGAVPERSADLQDRLFKAVAVLAD